MSPLTGCRWPIGLGEGPADDFSFCGADADGPFCQAHAKIHLSPTDGLDLAIQRGLLTAVKVEHLRFKLEDAMTGILWIGGVKGLEACVAGSLERVRSARITASVGGEGAT